MQLNSRLGLTLGSLFIGLSLSGVSSAMGAETKSKQVIEIPASNGRLEWSKVWREVSRQAGVDLGRSLPSEGAVNLNSSAARWTIIGLNVAMRGEVHLATGRKNDRLIVSLNRAALKKKRDKYGRRFREMTIKNDDEESLGFRFEKPGMAENAKLERLVVVTHGFTSSPANLAALQRSLSREGHVMASFGYHSRFGVVDSAATFSEELHRFQDQFPDASVTIVAHSMGGVVSRWMLEHAELCPRNVDQLIMIAPPNHGSDLTRPGLAGPPIRIKNVQLDPIRIGEWAGGVAEEVNAGIRDLRPGSLVLKRLDGLARNSNVAYSVILGDSGIVDPLLVSVTRQLLIERQHNAIAYAALEQFESFEGQMDELLDGRGDGVVSLDSGRLDGVDDLIILPMRHNDVAKESTKVFDVIQREVSRRIH